MRIHLSDQRHHFPSHSERLRVAAVMHYSPSSLRECTTTCDLGPAELVAKRAEAALFAYDIFPPAIMVHLPEWIHRGRPMQVGDSIVQQVHLPPWPRFSQKIVFGVRVREVFNSEEDIGFSYETLEGHVEKGISTFLLERRNDRMHFTIHTRSGAGNLLTALAGPIFSRPYQAYCTRQALAHVKGVCA